MVTTKRVEKLPVEQRLVALLRHLGIGHAHFAVRMTEDWGGLATHYPELIASLTLVCRTSIDPEPLQGLAPRLQVIVAEQAPALNDLRRILQALPQVTEVSLPQSQGLLWDDVALDEGDAIAHALETFVARMESRSPLGPSGLSAQAGEVAGVTYRVEGSGPPLVLLPLGLAPSQWAPLMPRLNASFTTITLSGPLLGIIPMLEARGRSRGYWGIVRNALTDAQFVQGHSLLEVGCGSGILSRRLAQLAGAKSQVTGVDINEYLLGEAEAAARSEQLDAQVSFRTGNAEDLPFADDTFDITFSSTVMEEVDADKMLAEMIRVTKAGGRVAVIVRAMDLAAPLNIPLPAALKARCESPRPFDEGAGCASVSLYRRFHASALRDIRMTPQLAVFDDPEGAVEKFLEGAYLAQFSPEERVQWHAAVAEAASEGLFFMTWPHHCAVGTKPR